MYQLNENQGNTKFKNYALTMVILFISITKIVFY